ncbi:MAG: mechanosensitive ion channel [Sandaracinaceae bacterium]|nr:mechanosensitive ion channel [Sandaracinaceae bacterium]
MNGDRSLMGDITSSGWVLGWVLVLGVVLYGALRAARFAVDVIPLSAERREALRRAFPVFSALSVLFYLLFSAGLFFERYPAHFPIAVAVILGVALAASWFGVRDVISGVFLKAGRVCRVGDYVRVGDIQGRVERMGLRAVVVETARGEEAILPYSRLTRDAVLRTPVSERGTLHVFELDLEPSTSVADTKRRIREAALTCHWSAIAREPEIAVLDGHRYEVTVFALDPDRVREVEAAVRAAVG